MPERCVSNWFEFSKLPDKLWLHSIYPGKKFEKAVENESLKFPAPTSPHASHLFSFAQAGELETALGEQGLEVDNSQELSLALFGQDGLEHPKIERRGRETY